MSPRRRPIRITRRFTTAGADPFAGIAFARRRSAIYNTDGSIISEMDDVEVPESWDQVAVDILVSKYFRKAGVPQRDAEGVVVVDADGKPVLGAESSARQWALRMADSWALWGKQAGYFATAADAAAYRDEMAYMVMTQKGSPNSPQHFNTGLHSAYGIVAPPEGNWYVDPEDGEVKLSAHRYERSAVNACFINSVSDELVGEDSIFDLFEREARLFKSGSGTGTNFSSIRAKGELLSGGGTSSGVMSFLRVGDRGAGSIKSGGTTRRAAKMVILDADHPEIEAFIWCKVREEEKVAALVAGGFSADWNGEAYDTVAFQNGNNSVRLPEGFLDAVRNNDVWELTARSDGRVMKTIAARDLWDQIADAAWRCADPGVQFDDILNDWNTAANDARLRGTNPCSEYVHIDDTACNLASLNLVAFFDTEAQHFDFAAFEHAVRLFTITLEISVTMSHYPSAKIARNSFEHRTLGLGYANLGALLMRAGLPYDSPAGLAVTGAVTALMHNVAGATSAELARAVGPCIAYGRNVEPMEKTVRNHVRAAYGSRLGESDLGAYEDLHVVPPTLDHTLLATTAFADLSDRVLVAAQAHLNGRAQGRRNMQVSNLAPTGTIGLQMSCDTTGIEPDFALVKFKKLAGGGYMKIVNNSVAPALHALGYDDAQVARILTHAVGTATLDGSTAVNRPSALAKGVPAEALDRVQAQLAAATEIGQAFGTYTVGTATLEAMGIAPETYLNDGFELLAHLGFTSAEVASSSQTICGHQTVEGAADLRDEHLAVFDTANYCGDGTRVIAWEGHVRALGAVAAHLSGSASKTINMPNSATLEEIRSAYELAYDLGVKCCAVYRDGSKLSQVLSSQTKTDEATEAAVVEQAMEVVAAAVREIAPGTSPTAHYHGTTPPKFKLPNMRYGPTWKFTVGGTEVFLNAGEYEDGTLGEIFITVGGGKEGSLLSSVFSCFAMSISVGLQYGVPLERFADMFVWHNFEPRGMVAGHPNLKMATSIIDGIFKVLAFHYLERDDLVQVKEPRPARRVTAPAGIVALPAPPPVHPAHPDREPTVHEATGELVELLVAAGVASSAPAGPAPMPHYSSGNICHNCKGPMVRSGTCERCLNCGETSGCS